MKNFEGKCAHFPVLVNLTAAIFADDKDGYVLNGSAKAAFNLAEYFTANKDGGLLYAHRK
jgi:hypothetical protein